MVKFGLRMAPNVAGKEFNEAATSFLLRNGFQLYGGFKGAESLLAQIKGNAKEKALIHRNSNQLLRLINKMLDLSKLEGGAL